MTSCIPGSSQAGAVDEESFMSAFEEVKRVNIYSGRALAEELGKIRETLSKSSNDWKVSINSSSGSSVILGQEHQKQNIFSTRSG